MSDRSGAATAATSDTVSPSSAPLERRPWGTYQVLDEADTHKAKRLTVDPGHRLSYQLHHRRAEHWVIVAGQARVTLDDVVHDLGPGQAIDIPCRAKHRIENPAAEGGETLVFVEVQLGDYFGEDDIVRFDDDYGRGGAT
jgi:mannose-6-phosphate isomerase-like protein (cupin superfamily)